jgi:hypothetical protein
MGSDQGQVRGGGTYFVNRTSPTDIVVRAEIMLIPTGTGTANDVKAIKGIEDAIEKAASAKGYRVDLKFVDVAAPTRSGSTSTRPDGRSRRTGRAAIRGGSPTNCITWSRSNSTAITTSSRMRPISQWKSHSGWCGSKKS